MNNFLEARQLEEIIIFGAKPINRAEMQERKKIITWDMSWLWKLQSKPFESCVVPGYWKTESKNYKDISLASVVGKSMQGF